MFTFTDASLLTNDASPTFVVRTLEADIRKMKEEDRTQKRVENERKQDLKGLRRTLREKTDRLAAVEHQWEIDQRFNHFVMTGKDAVAIDLLLQLRYGEEQAKYDIRTSEYLPLLKILLSHEAPEKYALLEKCGLEWKKLTICYLIALGLDDVEMMARAACLAPNSVKACRKECLQVIGDENLSDRVETFC